MKHKSTLVLLTFLLPLFLNGCGDGNDDDGSTVILSWTAPSEREDGSVLSLSDIAGYRIYYGVETSIYHGQIDINDHTATQAQLSGVSSGKYFIVITTIDTDVRESVFSHEVETTKY
jgi:hypothetical protein